MRTLRALLFAALCLSAAEPDLTPAARTALNRIEAATLKSHVSFLASDVLEGRDTPSRGLDVAAEYIAAQFRRAGLEPIGDDGYFQTATMVQMTPKLEGLELTVEIGESKYTVSTDQIMLMNAKAVALEHTDAVLVKTAAEITPERLAGKVALVDYAGLRTIRSLTDKLVAAKAAAVLCLMPSAPFRGQGGRPRLAQASELEAPAMVVAGTAEGAKAIQDGTPLKVSLKVPEPSTVPVKLRNVAGILRGTDPALKDTYVLLSAHYDHVGINPRGEGDRIMNGANDNASGTASIIEAAYALAPLKLRRSVVFIAWFGEEIGGYGARHYVQNPLVPLERTIANVNLEQTGRTDDPAGPQMRKASLTGFDYSEIGAVFARAGEQTGVTVFKDEKRSDSYFRRSDNATLADAGIPAHTLCTAFEYPDYHRASDHWDKLDYANMEQVTRMIAAGVWTLSERDQAPKWDPTLPATERYRAKRPQ